MSLTDSSRSARRRPSSTVFLGSFFPLPFLLKSSGGANPSEHHSHPSSQRHCVSTKSRAPEPGPVPVDPETHPRAKSSSKTTQVPGEYLKYLLISQPASSSARPFMGLESPSFGGGLVPGAGKTRPRSDTKPQTKILCALCIPYLSSI